MSDPEFKDRAEEHWQYTEKIIQLVLELTHVAYVEGMKHGFKHGKEEETKK